MFGLAPTVPRQKINFGKRLQCIEKSCIKVASCFSWPDKTTLSYTNWHDGKINADVSANCVEIAVDENMVAFFQTFLTAMRPLSNKYYWDNTYCNKRNYFDCEKVPTFSIDSLVAYVLELENMLFDRTSRKPISMREKLK